MPTNGLSLVGFISDQQQAIQHLRLHCIPPEPSDSSLITLWQLAKQKLDGPIPNSGTPLLNPMPPSATGYVQSLIAQPWVQEAFRFLGYVNAEFKMVEIDPLLAYQFFVDIDRSDALCSGLTTLSVIDLLPVFLPQSQPKLSDVLPLSTDVSDESTSVAIKAKNLNFRQINKGIIAINQNGFESWVVGVQMYITLPFVQVVRFNGRCYLHNGFHRAYGARKAGATEIPCLFRDVTRPEDIGINPGQTFDLQLLESATPPTVGHFTQGRAVDVILRSRSQTTHITWSESLFPDEYDRMNP
jgi:hypothetical protein